MIKIFAANEISYTKSHCWNENEAHKQHKQLQNQ